MKKFILAMVFVFSTGTMMNANTCITYKKVIMPDCFEVANTLTNFYEDTHHYASYTQVYNEFVRLYDECEAR